MERFMSIGIRNQNAMGYCKMMAGYVGGVGLAVAYQMGAIGTALTAIGAIGCLWAIAEGREDTSEIAVQASRLIHPQMSRGERRSINGLVGRLQENERNQVVDLVSHVMHPQMDTHEIHGIVGAVLMLPAHERTQVIGLASRLIHPQLSCDERISIIQEVNRIPANKRKQAVYFAFQITTKLHYLDIRDMRTILRGVASMISNLELSVNECEQVADLASRYMHPRTKIQEILPRIHALARIPANEREKAINFTFGLFPQESTDQEREEIINVLNAIADIPANEHEQILSLASRLFSADVRYYGAIIENVGRIPSKEREQVIDLASRLITQEMKGRDRPEIISVIAKIPANERERVIFHASRLIHQKMNFSDSMDIIREVASIPANEQEQVMTLASSLFTQDSTGRERFKIIQAIAGLHANDREQVTALASRLITQFFINTEGLDKNLVINLSANILANEGEQFITLVSSLITPESTFEERFQIIQAIAGVPANEREQVTALASSLITQFFMDAEGLDISSIIDLLATIPANEREQVITLASILITQELDYVARGQIIGAVARAGNERADRVQIVVNQIPQDLQNGLENADIVGRMIIILETPLNQPIPLLHGEMVELAAQGQNAIDVHHGGRDAKTREAIELLKKQQGPLETNTITEALGNFIQYLNDYKDNADIKAKAQQALNGQPEIWPPLLHNNALHAVDGGRLRISGEELIARLWIFANEQNSDKERENCRFGIIKALSDSIEHGTRVCPPGQTQRQVIAVLQGRLEGVNVDDVEVIRTKTLNEHTAAFLSGQMGTTDRAQLIQAAGEYLNQNPDVDRDPFMAAITTYANNSL